MKQGSHLPHRDYSSMNQWCKTVIGTPTHDFEFALKGFPSMKVLGVANVPYEGYTTWVTDGASLPEHPAWKYSRPELLLVIHSLDIDWGRSIGRLLNALRGDFTFERAKIVMGDEPIAKDTRMSGFLIYFPMALDRDDEACEVGGRRVTLSQLYPVYSKEEREYERLGHKHFFELIEPVYYEPDRRPVAPEAK